MRAFLIASRIMEVVSAQSLRASSVLWQSGASRVFTLICKATFSLAPGEAPLSEDQEEVNEENSYWDDDPARSLYAPSDVVPFKARADVLLVGNAFAPRGEPVRSLVVRMLVGEIDKAIEVFVDRAWRQDGALHEGSRFSRMALRYERAAGGPDSANPIGVRADARPNSFGMVALPNLQPPGLSIAARSDTIPIIGFGPIAPAWPSRREKLGRLAASGLPDRWNLAPLPSDIDPAYFNSAPRDQQVDEIRINERIVLENLHPDHPRLVTSLPGVRPRAFIELAGRPPQEIGMRCETLWIDTSRSICTLTWRGHVENPPAGGRVRTTLERPGQQLTWAEVEQQTPAPPERPKSERKPEDSGPLVPRRPQTITMTVDDLRKSPLSTGLPFAGAPGSQPTSGAPPTGERASMPSLASFAAPTPVAAMPFAAPAPVAAMPFAAPAPVAAVPAAMPFAAPAPVAAMPFAAPALAPLAAMSFVAPAAVVAAPAAMQFAAPAPVPPPSVSSMGIPSESRWSNLPEPGPAAPLGSRWSNSDARADTPASMTVGQVTAPPVSAPAPTAPSAPIVAATPIEAKQSWAGKALQLVWFEPECLPRVHRKPEFQPLLRALEDRAPDTELDDPSLAKDPAAMEDRRDIFEVLALGHALDEPGLNHALERAVRDDGKFIPPLALVDGEVRFLFDEIETLRATLTIAAVFSTGDEALKAAIVDAREFLRTPDLRSPPSVTEGYTTRIQDALKRAKRAVAPGYLEEQTERVLVEARHYQRRTVYGAPHLRALLQIGNAGRPWPLYVPEAAAGKLPMFARFPARVLAEVGFQENQYEAHPTALRALAIARVSSTPGKTDRDS